MAKTKGSDVNDNRRSRISRHDAAARAAVHAFGECFGSDCAAVRAFLASPARIDSFRDATGAFCLVACERDDLRPRGVIDVLSEHPGCQAFDVEVFEGDPAETADQIAGNFVAEIPALGCGVSLELGERGAALLADVRPPLAARERPLAAAKALCGPLRPAGPGDHLAVAQRHERGQPKIDANAIRPGALNRRDLDVEDHVPFAGLPRQDCGFRFGRHLAVPADFDFSGHTNEAELAGLAKCKAVADAKIGGVVAVARLEPGKSGLLSPLDATESGPQRLVEFAHHLLLRSAGPAADIGQRLTDAGQRDNLAVAGHIGVGLAGDIGEAPSDIAFLDLAAPGLESAPHHFVAGVRSLPVRVKAFLKCGIVERAKVGEHRGQRSCLHPVRLNPEFVAQNHGLFALLIFDVAAHSGFADGAHARGEIGPAPQRRKPGPQVRKLLAQETRGRALEAVDDFGNGARRIALDKDVHVIRHHLKFVNHETVMLGYLAYQLLEPGVHGRRQYGAPVLRAPYDVKLEAENRSGILRISWPRVDHATIYRRRTANCQQQKKGRQFPRQLKQTVPLAQE